jgi:hypothetical protein
MGLTISSHVVRRILSAGAASVSWTRKACRSTTYWQTSPQETPTYEELSSKLKTSKTTIKHFQSNSEDIRELISSETSLFHIYQRPKNNTTGPRRREGESSSKQFQSPAFFFCCADLRVHKLAASKTKSLLCNHR